jgi:arylsulfatase A-like enzyme/Tfp pilus assembly protein PilF
MIDVLLVTIDTIRADHVGCYGSSAGATPNLDALAARGVVFVDATTPAPLTLPAHVSILSGQWVHVHGVESNSSRVPAELALFPDQLAAAGWTTGAFTSGRPVAGSTGLAAHFTTYDDARPDSLGGPRYPPERRAAETAAAASAWLETAKEPFFGWVHFYDPHEPFTPSSAGGDPYDGEIRDADAGLGALLAALQKRGVADRTLIVALGDHGEGLGDHGEPHHGVLLYQPTVRVPLIVAGPGVVPARRADPVASVDVAPTILGRADLPYAGPGVDLLGPPKADRVLFSQASLGHERYGWAALQSVRRGPLVYVAAPRPESYDVVKDPGEKHDLGDLSLAGLVPPATAAVESAPSAELVALGYAAPDAATGGPDPKDRIQWLAPLEHAADAVAGGRFDVAIALLQPIVRGDPTNPAAANDLGMALSRTGHAREAVAVLQTAAKLAPADPTIEVNLGYAAAAAGDLATARVAYERAASLDPTFPAPCLNRAMLELRAGDRVAAARWLAEALARDPTMPEALALKRELAPTP